MFNQLLMTKDFDSFLTPASPAFKVDVVQAPTEYELKAELPGVAKDKIEVTFNKEVLTIKATKKEEKNSKEEGFSYREISYGSFERRFRLPNVDGDKIDVSLKDGILSIKAPLQEKASPRVISIRD